MIIVLGILMIVASLALGVFCLLPVYWSLFDMSTEDIQASLGITSGRKNK